MGSVTLGLGITSAGWTREHGRPREATGSVTFGLGITSAGWTREAMGGHELGRPRGATGGHGFGNFGAGNYRGRWR